MEQLDPVYTPHSKQREDHSYPTQQDTREGSLSFLQGIFPTQGLNAGLLPCRRILYQLSHKVLLPNSYNEVLTPNVVVFGDGASNELIKAE